MRVIILVVDGVRVDTLTGALDAGMLPAMARLRSEGGLYEVTSAFPSVTGPAYTPFLMGRFPGSVGLPGLRWFDRSREACSFPDYSRSYVGYQLSAVDRDLDPAAATIFELVPESVAAFSMITRGLPKGRRLLSLTPGSAWRAARTHFRGDLRDWLRVDRDVSSGVLECVRTSDTRFVFAAFLGADKLSHARGQRADVVMEPLRIVDDTVAELRSELERQGTWEDTHLWITSDHGHSRVRHHEELARVIGSHGYRVLCHPWVFRIGADVAVMVSGNAMAHVYVDLQRRDRPFRDGMTARARELIDTLVIRESVDLLIVPNDRDSCDVWSRTRGRATVARDRDAFSYVRASGDPLGVGHDVLRASATEAHAATLRTDYPDSIVQIARLAASDRAGDLILSASRDWDFRARYEPIPHVSSHGALHRDHMLVPLLLGRRPGRIPRRTADLMPSALQALQIVAPTDLDGQSFF